MSTRPGRPPHAPGETLAGHELRELVGMGGMGAVYRAWDPALGRQLALKVLRTDRAASPEARQRLLREARAYSRLDHPGVASVYAVGEDRGHPFIAMEWVEGRSVAELLRDGPLPLERALDLTRQVAEALAAVHRAGMIHRDVKPGNVMVDDHGRATLIDFGAASLRAPMDDPARFESTLTRDGLAPGTALYMSPEQILGEPLDGRSDLFSLGVLLYEILTGVRPFPGPTLPQLVQQLLSSSRRPLREHRPDLPPDLVALVERTLARDRDQRPASAEELARDLAAWVGPGPRLSASRPPRIHRRLLALLLIVLLFGIARLALPWMGVGVPPEPPPGASPAAAPEAPGSLPTTPYQHYRRGRELLVHYERTDYVEEAIESFEAALTLDDRYAPAHAGLATAYRRLYSSRRDPAWLDRGTARAERALELDPQLFEARLEWARFQLEQGEGEAARRELDALRALDPASAEPLLGLAALALSEGLPERAVALCRQARALAPENWETHSELGRALTVAGSYGEAEEAFRAGLEAAPDNHVLFRNLGAVLHYQGRYPEAIRALQTSITIRPYSRTYSNLGTALFFEGSFHQAAEAFEHALSLDPGHAVLWANLGDAYRQLPARAPEARTCFARAAQLLRAQVGERPREARDASRLALYLAKAGRPDDALPLLEGLEPLAEIDGASAYRATIAYELSGERTRALTALAAALEAGYSPAEIRRDPELISLRDDVRFHRLMVPFDG